MNEFDKIWNETMGCGACDVKPCEDCISRTKLLERIDEERKHLLDLKMDGAEHILVHHARRIIEDMPSVKPQRPKGKWIVNSCVRRNDVYHYTVHCDKCGKIWDYTTDKKDSIPSDYCPNCGAKMAESEE